MLGYPEIEDEYFSLGMYPNSDLTSLDLKSLHYKSEPAKVIYFSTPGTESSVIKEKFVIPRLKYEFEYLQPEESDIYVPASPKKKVSTLLLGLIKRL